jgi:hypothetical protein
MRCRPAQFVDAHVRKPDVPDLPRGLQISERANGVFQRHAWIGRVQLIEIDPLQPQPPQTPLAGGVQMLRPAVRVPGLAPGPRQTALGRNHEPFGIRIERFGNEPLVDLRPVGIGGVDESDTKLDGAHEHALRVRKVERLAPHTGTAEAHGAEP